MRAAPLQREVHRKQEEQLEVPKKDRIPNRQHQSQEQSRKVAVLKVQRLSPAG